MNLKNQKQTADWAGVSNNAVNKALKPNDGRLEFFPGTKKIDCDSVKAQAFKASTATQRHVNKLNTVTNPVTIIQPSEVHATTPQISQEATNDLEKFAKHRAEKTKQEAKNVTLKNAHLEGTLVEKEVILTGALMYFDTLHQNLDRFFGTVLDNLAPKILASGDCTPSIAQEAIDEGKRILHEGKINFLSRVEDIIKGTVAK